MTLANEGPSEEPRLRVLILGGAGVFGSRIAKLLADDPHIEIIIAGRGLERAEAIVRDIQSAHPRARISARVIDRDGNLAAELSALHIGLLIHAAGPFRDQDATIARASLNAGTHYLDLADDRAFVLRFNRLDAAAKAARRVAISGLSSVPAISSAAVAALAQGLAVSEIRIGITPGNRAPRGPAVIASVLAGVGQASEQRKAGAWVPVRGWQDLHRRSLEVSGCRTLTRWLSHVEVPDPDLLQARYPDAETITFHAGLELTVLHLGLWALSWPVRWRWIKDLSRLAPQLGAIANAVRWAGSDEGGMFVEVVGRNAQGQWLKRSWTLHAGAGDGPMIPAIPAALVAKAIAAGAAPPPGARSAMEALPLETIEAAFAPFAIKTERIETPLEPPLYERILGDKFGALPAPLRDLHMGRIALRFEGEASVARGKGAAALMAGMLGLPIEAAATPVSVLIEPAGRGEVWTRRFGARGFASRLGMAKRKGETVLIEQFGPFGFAFALDADETHVVLRQVSTRWLGVPLPRRLWPRITAEERTEAGRFIFDVSVSAPIVGALVHYKGWLEPKSATLRSASSSPAQGSAQVEAREPVWPR